MNAEEIKKFNKANEVVHKVEDQWHYPIMMKAGYKSHTKEGVGFVRSYKYVKGDHEVTCVTGASSDHWNDNKGGFGYWASLESNLK
ncbi:MAG TPA: hypothetical protein VMW50_10045 [Dehalococcoidia bacterium]|nr:hypothetical protein [Dehalococcoidia bacterium]